MDNVQKVSNCINILSSQTFRSSDIQIRQWYTNLYPSIVCVTVNSLK
jgi:hypothetical protein